VITVPLLARYSGRRRIDQRKLRTRFRFDPANFSGPNEAFIREWNKAPIGERRRYAAKMCGRAKGREREAWKRIARFLREEERDAPRIRLLARRRVENERHAKRFRAVVGGMMHAIGTFHASMISIRKALAEHMGLMREQRALAAAATATT